MIDDSTYIKISPENLKSDIVKETLSGITFGVYSGLTQILSGGTNGQSLLTGLTIPIVFTQTIDDLGFYTPFDGFMLQKDVVTNFVITGDTNNIYTILLYNTSEKTKKFLKLSSYQINWGDGSSDTFGPNDDFLSHTYNSIENTYTVSMVQRNPWGITQVEKKVTLPHTGVTINNPQGNITFTPQGGQWSGTPINYNFIFSGDSENTVSQQTSDNFTNVPFLVTGFTTSKLEELKLYGPVKYNPAVVVKKYGQDYGQINEITPLYTAYTIDNVQYYDNKDGTTFFMVESSGLTENMIEALPITKEEVLLGVVSSPEIQSGIFIERGKNSAFEALQRLGEVDNIGDLTSYGYGFFKINKT